ncbi:MAG: dihydrofolate reductase family protein [Verrucomicrobia bacterium]|nr:dihydrofolate reductase family protein [Verrucomicrobiota bacterium]
MQRPRISTNLAISADGKITSADRRPSGWTSKKDHARLKELRQTADAILVGMGTLIADRMTLTCLGKSKPPLRCVISRGRAIDPEHPTFHRAGGPIHLVITGKPLPTIDPGTTDKPGATAATATGALNDYLPRSISFELKHFEPDPTLGECFICYGRKTIEATQ